MRKTRDVFDVLLLIVAWGLLFFLAPHDLDSDAIYRRAALVDLVEHHHWSSVKWPMIGAYLSAPLYMLGKHWQTTDWWLARYNVLLLGIGTLSLDRILKNDLPRATRRAFLLLLLTSAMLPHESTESGAEVFNAMGIAVGLAAWGTKRYALGTVLTAIGAANMPASIVGLFLALFFDFVKDRRWRVALPLVFAVALVLGENWIRKGGALHSGYDHEQGYKTFMPYSGLPDFSYPLYLGVLSLIFSFGKGILFFTPGLFLPWRAESQKLEPSARRILIFWILFVVGLFAVYSRWWSWYGGYWWGPRFLIFASVPASFILALHLRMSGERKTWSADVVTFMALVVQMWAGATGITFRMVGQPFCMGQSYAHESYCWYIPEFSVLATPFVEHANTNWDMRLLMEFVAFVGVYLGVPLIVRLAQHAYRASEVLVSTLDPRTWRI